MLFKRICGCNKIENYLCAVHCLIVGRNVNCFIERCEKWKSVLDLFVLQITSLNFRYIPFRRKEVFVWELTLKVVRISRKLVCWLFCCWDSITWFTSLKTHGGLKKIALFDTKALWSMCQSCWIWMLMMVLDKTNKLSYCRHLLMHLWQCFAEMLLFIKKLWCVCLKVKLFCVLFFIDIMQYCNEYLLQLPCLNVCCVKKIVYVDDVN